MIMPNPPKKPKKNASNPKKRLRLTPKQKDFLHWVLTLGATVEYAMDNLHIQPRMLDRWLAQPHFNQAIDFKLSQFRLQIRINASLFAPRAVRTLGYMFNTEADFETKRKASVDLLKLLEAIHPDKSCGKSQTPRISQAAPDGAQAAYSGAQTAQNGAPAAHNGSPRRTAVNQKRFNFASNPRFQLQIDETK